MRQHLISLLTKATMPLILLTSTSLLASGLATGKCDLGTRNSSCTVTVYVHGSSPRVLGTLFADNAVTPKSLPNPFPADTSGRWSFFASPGMYDVVMSAGRGAAAAASETTVAIVDPAANVLIADNYPGNDLGAKINASDRALGSTAGEIWVNTSAAPCVTDIKLSENHKLRFGPGTYVWNCTLRGSSGTALTGAGGSYIAGQSTVLKRTSGTRAMASFVGQYSGSGAGHVSNFLIQDVGFDGGGLAGNGILLQNVDSFRLRGIAMRNGGAAPALHLYEEVWDYWVSESSFTNWGDSQASAETIRIQSNTRAHVATDGHWTSVQFGEVGRSNPILNADANTLQHRFIDCKFHWTGNSMPYMVNWQGYRTDFIGSTFQGSGLSTQYQLRLAGATNSIIGGHFVHGEGVADAIRVSGGNSATVRIIGVFMSGLMGRSSGVNILPDIGANTTLIIADNQIESFGTAIRFGGSPTIQLGQNLFLNNADIFAGEGSPTLQNWVLPSNARLTLFNGSSEPFSVNAPTAASFIGYEVNNTRKWVSGIGATAADDQWEVYSDSARKSAFSAKATGDTTVSALGSDGNIRLNASGSGSVIVGGSAHVTVAAMNSDMSGELTIGSGNTSIAKTFSRPFNNPPACSISPEQDMDPASLRWWVSTNTTSLTIRISAATAARLKFFYHCFGNPN